MPKQLLRAMRSVEGLSRENVASHLQKYRSKLKKTSSVEGDNDKSEGGEHPADASSEEHKTAPHTGNGTKSSEKEQSKVN